MLAYIFNLLVMSLKLSAAGFFHIKYVGICHGRKSNLVEFQILPVESPIGISTGRKSNLGDLGIAWESEI